MTICVKNARLCFVFILLFQLFIFKIETAKSDDTIAFDISINPNDLFASSLTLHLLDLTPFDYNIHYRPLKRSLWEIQSSNIDMIGIYSDAVIEKHISQLGLKKETIQKLPIIMDTSPLFAISLWEDYSIDTIRKNPDTRIGYVHHDSLFHLFPESKSFIAKSLDQLVNLLLIKRVDVLVVTKKNLNQVLKNFPYQKFKTSLRPIYFENTYYFYHSKSKDKIATIKQAYDQLITTPYYQTLFENFSNQNSWQD